MVLAAYCSSSRDAGHLRRTVRVVHRYGMIVAALLAFASFAYYIGSWSEQKDGHLAGQSAPRIVLTKRAPLPLAQLDVDGNQLKIASRRRIKYEDIERRMQAVELKPNPEIEEPMNMTPVDKESEYLQPPIRQSLANHPIIAKLDQKRKIDHLELQQSDQKVKKAQAQRDAILSYKPTEKYEKGRRASELTMSNLSLGKAAIVKQVKKIQAIHSDNKFHKVVNKVNEQNVVAA